MDVTNKRYVVDSEISKINPGNVDTNNFVLKSGDLMTGLLILAEKNYPISGSLNQALSYQTMRTIFVSRHESEPMLADLNINSNNIHNLGCSTHIDDAVPLIEIQEMLALKLDSNSDIDMRGHKIEYVGFSNEDHSGQELRK